MAKNITFESLYNYSKFNVDLGEDLDYRLRKYIYLNDNKPTRNQFVKEVIEKALEGKVLDNDFINIQDRPFYFNKNELLKEGKVKATKNLPLHNLDEIFVVQLVPNNLDDFNKELKTYCVGDNPNKHAGYYIIPKYKDHERTYFSFNYDSEKEELEIGIENRANMDIAFNPVDEEKQKIKQYYLDVCAIHEIKLENGELTAKEFLYNYNIMYSYYLNLELHKLRKKQETEGGRKLTEAEIEERDNIYFKGMYLK